MKYENLKKKMELKMDEQKEDATKLIQKGTELNPDQGLSVWLTDSQFKKYKAAPEKREDYVNLAISRMEASYKKRVEKELARMQTFENAPLPTSLDIHVHWTKSPVWGKNPTVHATVHGAEKVEKTYGHASGCNYDKRSMAVSNALDASEMLRRLLCDAMEEALSKDPEANPRDVFGDGVKFAFLPEFGGAVGMGAIESTFQHLGWTYEEWDRGVNEEYYSFYPKTE